MDVNVELNENVLKYYSQELITDITQKTIEIADIINYKNKRITLSVAVVDEIEMQRINKQLRNYDAVTDVLSIGDYSDEKNITQEVGVNIFLGEVILCYNYIKRVAFENGDDVNKEFFTIYAHGILHLLGFVHGKKMFYLQDEVCKKFII